MVLFSSSHILPFVFFSSFSSFSFADKFRAYFEKFGPVEDAQIMRDKFTQQSRGFGFITFVDSTVAERVLRENMELDGRRIDPKLAVPRGEDPASRGGGRGGGGGGGGGGRFSSDYGGPSAPARTTKIFVGGVTPETTSEELKDYFAQFGEVAEAQIMVDHTTNRSRGFGFVTFGTVSPCMYVCIC